MSAISYKVMVRRKNKYTPVMQSYSSTNQAYNAILNAVGFKGLKDHIIVPYRMVGHRECRDKGFSAYLSFMYVCGYNYLSDDVFIRPTAELLHRYREFGYKEHKDMMGDLMRGNAIEITNNSIYLPYPIGSDLFYYPDEHQPCLLEDDKLETHTAYIYIDTDNCSVDFGIEADNIIPEAVIDGTIVRLPVCHDVSIGSIKEVFFNAYDLFLCAMEGCRIGEEEEVPFAYSRNAIKSIETLRAIFKLVKGGKTI